jgi:hypothetical protein
MYQKLLKWCKDSEVILFARVQYIGGALLAFGEVVFGVVSHTDLSIFISNPKIVAAIGIVNGVVIEVLRTYRATDLRV